MNIIQRYLSQCNELNLYSDNVETIIIDNVTQKNTSYEENCKVHASIFFKKSAAVNLKKIKKKAIINVHLPDRTLLFKDVNEVYATPAFTDPNTIILSFAAKHKERIFREEQNPLYDLIDNIIDFTREKKQ